MQNRLYIFLYESENGIHTKFGRYSGKSFEAYHLRTHCSKYYNIKNLIEMKFPYSYEVIGIEHCFKKYHPLMEKSIFNSSNWRYKSEELRGDHLASIHKSFIQMNKILVDQVGTELYYLDGTQMLRIDIDLLWSFFQDSEQGQIF